MPWVSNHNVFFLILNILMNKIFYEIFWGKVFFFLNRNDNQLWRNYFPTLFENTLENFSVYIHFFPSVLFILELSFFFPPSISPFSILGPLSKKQTDDLGDNDGAEDEGILSTKSTCMTRTSIIFSTPFYFFTSCLFLKSCF